MIGPKSDLTKSTRLGRAGEGAGKGVGSRFRPGRNHMGAGKGVGSRFRASSNHMGTGPPKTTPDPFSVPTPFPVEGTRGEEPVASAIPLTLPVASAIPLTMAVDLPILGKLVVRFVLFRVAFCVALRLD